MKDPVSPELDRRDLFKVLASAVGAGVLDLFTLDGASAHNSTDLQTTRPRYRETDDVRVFYRVSRCRGGASC
jgi:hypothetical protein